MSKPETCTFWRENRNFPIKPRELRTETALVAVVRLNFSPFLRADRRRLPESYLEPTLPTRHACPQPTQIAVLYCAALSHDEGILFTTLRVRQLGEPAC